jgi:predicted N-acetyltransferase YhbS
MMTEPKVNIVVVPEHDFNPALDAKVREQLCQAFPHSAWYFQDSRGWKGAMPTWSVVAFDEGDEPIAHIGIVERVITIESASYSIFGIQNVYVTAAWRGKGIASRMVHAIAVEAEKRSLDFGLLFCRPHVEALYVNAGWESVGKPCIYVLESENHHEVPRPFIHDSLFFKSIKVSSLPPGCIHFNGPDW